MNASGSSSRLLPLPWAVLVAAALLAATACKKDPEVTSAQICANIGAKVGAAAGGGDCVKKLDERRARNPEEFACYATCAQTASAPVQVEDCELACGAETATPERICIRLSLIAPDAGNRGECMQRLETMRVGYMDRYRCVNHCVLTARDAELARTCESRCGG